MENAAATKIRIEEACVVVLCKSLSQFFTSTKDNGVLLCSSAILCKTGIKLSKCLNELKDSVLKSLGLQLSHLGFFCFLLQGTPFLAMKLNPE